MIIYRLNNPWALLFLLLPLACLLIVILQRFVFKKGVRITGSGNFGSSLTPSVLGYYTAIISILAGLFIIAFSLSKPQYGIKREKIVSEGLDIMIALDVSYSMTSQDFLMQSRIEGAKKIIENFIDKRKGDRLGLVTFGESSFLKCPATINFKLLKEVVSGIKITRSNSGSTAIGVGLASCINRLLNIKDNTKPESKMIILVTDGINNSGEISPQAALDIAKENKIKIYTVGVGSSEEVDVAMLKAMADNTNGKFFHAKNSGDFGNIFDEIDNLEKHKIETIEYTRFKDIGFFYATLGIILLMMGLIINTLFFKRLG